MKARDHEPAEFDKLVSLMKGAEQLVVFGVFRNGTEINSVVAAIATGETIAEAIPLVSEKLVEVGKRVLEQYAVSLTGDDDAETPIEAASLKKGAGVEFNPSFPSEEVPK